MTENFIELENDMKLHIEIYDKNKSASRLIIVKLQLTKCRQKT